MPEPTRNRAPTALLPPFVLARSREGVEGGSIEAGVLVVDLSGFTAMTQSLMRHGAEGAEVLTELIRAVFEPAIASIHRAGGFVSTFAGDAFTAVFTHAPPVPLPELAREIAAGYVEARDQPTRFGTWEVTARIGLAGGRVDWGIVASEPLAAYFFRGPAIAAAADACTACTPGSVSIAGEMPSLPPGPPPATGELAEDEVLRFVPGEVLSKTSRGEFRDIVSCLVSIDEEGDLVAGIAELVRHAETYGGYVNKVDFGDKGGVVLVLFGAPVGREHLQARGCDFALAVRRIPAFRTRIGLSFGRAFAGFVGSEERREYTAIGNVVNRSARLAFHAAWSEACVDETIESRIRSLFELEHLGDLRLKGFAGSMPAHRLKKRSSSRGGRTYQGPFLGRETELRWLEERCRPLAAGRFGGIVYVDGNPGAGKSRLVQTFLAEGEPAENRRVFHWSCDEILRKSFNPVHRFLRHRFAQDEEGSPDASRPAFDEAFEELLAGSEEPIRARLEEARSFLAAPFGLGWEGSPWEKADDRTRHLAFLQGVKALVRAEAGRRPVIIVLEDAQWIDSDTEELLRVLTVNVDDVPFLVLAPCRYTDEGQPFRLQLEGAPEHRIAIGGLERSQTEDLIRFHLEQAGHRPSLVSEELQGLVWKHSEGNPFYIEQLALYLVETGGIDPETGRLTAALTVPPGINTVITARLDRLGRDLRAVIKAAAVLGQEFSVRVLAAMLRESRLDEELTAGTGKNIWQELSEQYYVFRHGLIRQSAYEMQLRKQLRKLHRIAAEAYEDLHEGDLSPVLPELAEHYERAEVTDKALHYLGAAAEQARRAYHNPGALDFYDRLLALLPVTDPTRRFDALTGKAQVLKLLGRWDEAQELFTGTVTLAEEAGDRARLLEATINIGDILRYRGEYDEAMTCRTRGLELARELGDESAIATLLGNVGNIFLCRGQVDEAIDYYEQQKALAGRLGNTRELSLAAGNLGICYGRKREVDRAMECYLEQRRLAEEAGDKQSVAIATGNMGILHRRRGRLDEAMACYREQLELAREIGDKNGMAVVLGNIGGIHFERGETAQAEEHYDEQIGLAEELGDKRCLAHACGLMGKLLQHRGDVAGARRHYERQRDLSREIDHRRGYLAAEVALARLR